jgi:hypothetical protein
MPGADSLLTLRHTMLAPPAGLAPSLYGPITLTVQTGDDVFTETLGEGYGAAVYAADIDGDGLDELVVRVALGGSADMSHNRIYRYSGGRLVTVFDLDGFHSGWALALADTWMYTIRNTYTGHERVFRHADSEHFSDRIDPANLGPGESTVVRFEPVAADGGGFDIVLEAWLWAGYHRNHIGVAQTVLRWDGGAPRVIGADFWPFRDTYGEGPATRLRDALAANQGASEQAIEAFFRYYAFNYNEMRFLPPFETGAYPNWDDLTLFVFFQAEVSRTEDGYSFLTAAEFDRVMSVFFPDMPYTHKSSSHFNFKADIGHVAVGFSYHGGAHYRLVSLAESGGVWSAVFDMLSFSEDDYISPERGADPRWYSDNMRAMMAFNGGRHPDRGFEAVLLAMLLHEDYETLLRPSGRVEITFELQDDEQHPLRYLSKSVQWE